MGDLVATTSIPTRELEVVPKSFDDASLRCARASPARPPRVPRAICPQDPHARAGRQTLQSASGRAALATAASASGWHAGATETTPTLRSSGPNFCCLLSAPPLTRMAQRRYRPRRASASCAHATFRRTCIDKRVPTRSFVRPKTCHFKPMAIPWGLPTVAICPDTQVWRVARTGTGQTHCSLSTRRGQIQRPDAATCARFCGDHVSSFSRRTTTTSRIRARTRQDSCSATLGRMQIQTRCHIFVCQPRYPPPRQGWQLSRRREPCRGGRNAEDDAPTLLGDACHIQGAVDPHNV